MTTTSGDGSIYVNYGHVDNVEQALTDATQQVQNVLDNLQAVVNSLRGSWAGVSEDEYEPVQTRFNNDMAGMQAALAKYNSTLSDMKWNTFNTDQNLAFQWQQIT